jgi:hypothetical protein
LVESFYELVACLASRFFIDDYDDWPLCFVFYVELYLLGLLILAIVRCPLSNFLLLFLKTLESSGREIGAVTTEDFSGL